MRVAVIGAAGYAGGELLRLLLGHPDVEEVLATSRSQAGKPLDQVHPGLAGLTDARFAGLEPGEATRGRDVVFLALEHGESSRIMGQIMEAGPGMVLDLAADFRVRDQRLAERFYGAHAAPEYLDRFVYGLADVAGASLQGARAIAAPGCFATAAQLALYPLARRPGLTAPALFAVTGSSGAGVSLRSTTHHPSRAHNLFGYPEFSHRHEAEILEQWNRWTGGAGSVTPRLLAHSGPFVRGIYLTLHAQVEPGSAADLAGAFARAYAGRPFVRLLERPPELTHAVGSNLALIHCSASDDGTAIRVQVAIDNLVKGAGGQAVQAMNLALGLTETRGLVGGIAYPN